MEEILSFLQEAKTFFIATIEGDKPKVRPFAFAMIFENKLYFGTNDTKPSFDQLNNNANFEICAVKQSPEMEWVRLSGKAVFDERIEVKQNAFKVAPYLSAMYKMPENESLRMFYIDGGEATYSKMQGEPRTVKL